MLRKERKGEGKIILEMKTKLQLPKEECVQMKRHWRKPGKWEWNKEIKEFLEEVNQKKNIYI